MPEDIQAKLSDAFEDKTTTEIKAILTSFATDIDLNAQQAASEIATVWEHALQRGESLHRVGFLCELEDIFILVSRFVSVEHRDRLVQLVTALRNLPKCDTGPPWQSVFEGNPPGSLVEAYEGAQGLRSNLDNAQDGSDWHQWQSFNAFLANLTQQRVCDCSMHAIHAFRGALEESNVPIIEHSMRVLIACDWLRIAGERLIHGECRPSGYGKGGDLWEGEPGFPWKGGSSGWQDYAALRTTSHLMQTLEMQQLLAIRLCRD